MASSAKLQIIVDADTKAAEAGLQSVSDGVKGVSKSATSSAAPIGGLVKGIKGAALAAGTAFLTFQTLKKGMEFSLDARTMAIELERAELALAGFSGSGEEADKAIEAIVKATGGMVSRMTAAQAASRLFSMGLASNSTEAAKLTEMAVTLGGAMGKGPHQAIEEFTLMLANQSILRLDTFGISGAAVRDRMAELADSSFDAGKELNFMTAVMEQGIPKMEDLDDAGFEAGSSIDLLAVAADDTKAALGEMFTFIDDGADTLANFLTGIGDFAREQNILREALEGAGMSYAEYNALMQSAAMGIPEAVAALAAFRNEFILGISVGRSGSETVNEFVEVIDLVGIAAKQSEADLGVLWDGMTLIGDMTEPMSFNLSVMQGYHAAQEEGRQAMSGWTNSGRDMTKETKNMTDAIVALPDLRESQFLAGLDAAEQQFVSGNISSEELQGEIEALGDAFTAGDAFEDFNTTLADAGVSLQLAIDDIGELNDQKDAFTGVHVAEFRIKVFGDPLPEIFTTVEDVQRTATRKGFDLDDFDDPLVEDTAVEKKGGQHLGADFIVPPGFRNDSYPMLVESGERVQVTPAVDVGSGKGGNGDVQVHIHGNVYGVNDLQQAIAGAIQREAGAGNVHRRMR